MALPRLALCVITLLASASVAGKTLVVCTDANPEGFDVVQFNSLVTTNASADVLFNRLVEFDAASGELKPGLAERWTVSEDGRVLTFTLRRNVAFHTTDYFKPGRLLNADDVVFSFQRMLDPAHPWFATARNGYPHAQSFQLGKLVKRVSKLDAHTVQFELTDADATFLPLLSMGFASIYPAEYAAKLLQAGTPEKLNSQPVGTGPFIFKSFQKDALVRYDANPQYFAGRPKVDKLVYSITPDASVRVQRVKAGECQIALAPKPLDAVAAKSDPKLTVLGTEAFATAFIALNTQHKPFDNVLVRQAVNHAFDRASYLKSVFSGTAQPARNIFPPATWSSAKSLPGYDYDPARARELLARAGYPDGFSTTIWVRPAGSALNPNPKLGAEMLQFDLAKVGIKAEIRTIEWAELIRRAKAGEHDLLFMGWSGDNGDPDNFLTPQFSCAAVQSGTNFARFCDRELDRLIAAGKRNANRSVRSVAYGKAQQLIRDEALWLPLAHPTSFVLTQKNVSGYTVNPFGRQDFSGVSLR